MHITETPSAKEFADDGLQQAIDDAIQAVCDAEAEAKESVDLIAVFDHALMHYSDVDKRIFKRALEDGDVRDWSMVMSMLQDTYKDVVAEKKAEILSTRH